MQLEWKFSAHAVERMQKRQIFALDVLSVLSKPDGKIRQSQDKLIYYRKISTRKDNLIAVVVISEEKPIHFFGEILTVMNFFEVR